MANGRPRDVMRCVDNKSAYAGLVASEARNQRVSLAALIAAKTKEDYSLQLSDV